MGDRSSIEWTDATWNPITGCTPVSAGCANCYAERMVKRFPHLHGFDNPNEAGIRPTYFNEVQFHPDRLDIPLRWKKSRRIFVGSMTDLFHEDVSIDWLRKVFRTMALAPRHTFMILTKRPERMKELIQDLWNWSWPGAAGLVPQDVHGDDLPLPNVWVGTTAENQEMADQRIPILLQTPAAKRFVSVEPCLGPVDLTMIGEHGDGTGWSIHGDALHGGIWERRGRPERYTMTRDASRLDWVICGGESGPGARPMHPDWPRSLRDQCQAAGVPFFFKQWGNHSPTGAALKGNPYHEAGWNVKAKNHGCLLDGREWKEFPEVKG